MCHQRPAKLFETDKEERTRVPGTEVKQFTGLDTSDMKHISDNKYVG